jgi:hypothetical protein
LKFDLTGDTGASEKLAKLLALIICHLLAVITSFVIELAANQCGSDLWAVLWLKSLMHYWTVKQVQLGCCIANSTFLTLRSNPNGKNQTGVYKRIVLFGSHI